VQLNPLRNNDVDHISEVLMYLDGQIEVKILISFLVGSTIEAANEDIHKHHK
jgi:hypothetical protein